ncbi:uncharacterized protein [Montipora capricornis]|uniref:uncharacterized protein n=1 Tax=Montipora capricornis TaxID=246305 RepID=UPI0035F1CD69
MPASYETLNKKPRPTGEPPFTLKDLKAVVPPQCFERSTLRSFSYVAWDVSLAWLFYWCTGHFDHPYLPSWASYVLWPLYWVCQGCVCTGVWVLAHECGHYAFSDSKTINDITGLVLHSALLVPYHSWRISHAKHHRSTNDMDHDEVFVPSTKAEFGEASVAALSSTSNILNLLKVSLLGWPGYLLLHVTGRKYHTHTDHFNPNSPIFSGRDYRDVVISDIALVAWMGVLGYMAYLNSFMWLLKVYIIPYLIVNFWLVFITDLQHSDAAVPHYRGKEWNWLKGALCTIDRDYGILNHVFHHIGDTHIAHHLFSYMPHYHAVEATEHVKKVLGEYYYKETTSIFKSFWLTQKYCRYVDNVGDILWYKHD